MKLRALCMLGKCFTNSVLLLALCFNIRIYIWPAVQQWIWRHNQIFGTAFWKWKPIRVAAWETYKWRGHFSLFAESYTVQTGLKFTAHWGRWPGTPNPTVSSPGTEVIGLHHHIGLWLNKQVLYHWATSPAPIACSYFKIKGTSLGFTLASQPLRGSYEPAPWPGDRELSY